MLLLTVRGWKPAVLLPLHPDAPMPFSQAWLVAVEWWTWTLLRPLPLPPSRCSPRCPQAPSHPPLPAAPPHLLPHYDARRFTRSTLRPDTLHSGFSYASLASGSGAKRSYSSSPALALALAPGGGAKRSVTPPDSARSCASSLSGTSSAAPPPAAKRPAMASLGGPPVFRPTVQYLKAGSGSCGLPLRRPGPPDDMGPANESRVLTLHEQVLPGARLVLPQEPACVVPAWFVHPRRWQINFNSKDFSVPSHS